ncbi:MAG: hypothetical protein Q9216_004462 [Gyalolechia sp. 2 TL-2023]
MQAQKTTLHLDPRNDADDFTRSITLTLFGDPVIIGRASKTASKGLVPLPENAWFHSPIISREHGKLFLAAMGEVHIQDSASTHGTWIGKRRLASKESSKISNGDIVTFGTNVTSGPVTYQARSFNVRVSSTCAHVSPSSTRSKVSEKSTFSVPNDDADSLSDDSDRSSCQILDSHPRTFSVPSSGDEMEDSDDEDVVIPTSRGMFLASLNAANHKKSPSPHLNVHNGKGHQDSDEQNQRTKEGSQAKAHCFPSVGHESSLEITNTQENNSEDEGPEIFHWGPGQQSSSDRKANNEDTAAASMSMTEIQVPETYQPPNLHTSEGQNHSIEAHSDNWQATSMSAESQESNYAECAQHVDPVKSSQNLTDSTTGSYIPFHKPIDASNSGRPTLSRLGPTAEHGHVSFSQSSDGQEKNASRQQEGGSHIDNSASLSQSSASLYAADDTLSTEESLLQSRRGQEHLLGNDAEQDNDKNASQDLSREGLWPYLDRHTARKVSPMPSISACSPQSSIPISYHTPAEADYQSPYTYWNGRHLHTRPRELFSAIPKLDQSGSHTAHSNSYLITARPPSPSDAALPKVPMLRQAQTHESSTAAGGGDTINGCHGRPEPMNCRLPPAKFFGDLRSNPSMRAHRFSLASVLARASDDWQSEQANQLDAQQPKSAEYQQGPFSRSCDSFHTAENPSQTGPRSASPSPRKHCVVKLKFDNKTTDTRDLENSTKMSRVQISNLVNSQAEGSRGKKRKSNQMSTGESSSTATPQLYSFAARKTVPGRDTAAAADKPMFPGMGMSDVKAVKLPTIDADEDGPARKKTKTSGSKSGTVGKVVSGICLGIAGAFAAFVAATPMDVWEEALREAVKLK